MNAEVGGGKIEASSGACEEGPPESTVINPDQVGQFVIYSLSAA